ncbi:GNAT family N-acetyltransferase [Antarctobacter sp.]|uniref:GNAT family N-acetyltransferase n=1 Tax=Antarctobacter sp. TaxID=1872577 RepID=UPI002B26F162|nr:GNAT family N-acetyltransferase [Antarctobacter sp.]
MTAFTTSRLTVRPWETALDDADTRGPLEARLRLLLTPAVLEHLPPGFGPDPGPQGMDRWIALRREKAQVSLIERDAGLIGLLFLFSPEGEEGQHLGYLLGEAYWGQGYGSELVQGVVAHMRNGPPQSLHAGVTVDNPASARVLLKAGFKEDMADPRNGMRSFIYADDKSTQPKT